LEEKEEKKIASIKTIKTTRAIRALTEQTINLAKNQTIREVLIKIRKDQLQ
jgi:Mg/Co/Ni transporter MgtE